VFKRILQVYTWKGKVKNIFFLFMLYLWVPVQSVIYLPGKPYFYKFICVSLTIIADKSSLEAFINYKMAWLLVNIWFSVLLSSVQCTICEKFNSKGRHSLS
jgi:hypothetical protein